MFARVLTCVPHVALGGAEPQGLQAFRKAGGVEAIVRLFLAIDLTSPLPIWGAPASTASASGSAPADGETETGSGSGSASGVTSESNDNGSAPSPVGDDVSDKNESGSEKEKENENENESESEKAVDGAEGERQLEEGGGEAAATAAEEEASDDALVPQLMDTAEERRSLTHLLVQTLWMLAGTTAPPEDRCKVGTAKVIEQATAMFESDRTDIQTKVCSIAFLSCLVRNDKASIPVLMTTRARSVMFRAFAEATPDTDVELLARLAYALTPILGHNSTDRTRFPSPVSCVSCELTHDTMA